MSPIVTRTRIEGIAGLATAQVLLGTLGIFVIEAGQDPISTVFYRCLVGAAVLGAYCWAKGYLRMLPRGRALGLAVLSGVLMAANWVVFFAAMERVGIAVATIVTHIQPFLVLVFGALLFGERLQGVKLLWLALAFAGLVAAMGAPLSGEALSPDYAAGLGLALLGAVLYAWVTILARRIGGMKVPMLALIQCVVGIPLLALFAPVAPWTPTLSQWGWLLGIGAIHTGLVYVLFYGALPKLATPMIAALLFVYPASAVLFEAIVYGRMIDGVQAAGFAAIVLASLGVLLGWGQGALSAWRPGSSVPAVRPVR